MKPETGHDISADLEEAVKRAATDLKEGNIVAFPTDTVYGIGVDAFNEKAIKSLYGIKRRNEDKPFAILVSSASDSLKLIKLSDERFKNLAHSFWPGALTIVVNASNNVPCLLKSSNGKIGIRMPNHPAALKLLAAFGNPIASTSANPSGLHPPKSREELIRYFPEGVSFILEGGPKPSQLASTVVDISGEDIKILREGLITKTDILNAL